MTKAMNEIVGQFYGHLTGTVKNKDNKSFNQFMVNGVYVSDLFPVHASLEFSFNGQQ